MMAEELLEIPAGFRENEYAVLKGFFPRALLRDYRAFLERALAEEVWPVFRRVGLDPQDPELPTRVAHLIEHDPQLTPINKQLLLGHFPLAVRLSDAINPIAQFMGASPLLKALLHTDALFMHMPPMARFVPPRYASAAVPPHQDISYNTHMGEFLVLWMPLVPIDHECGGLVMYRGGHHNVHAIDSAAHGWLSPIDVAEFERHPLVGLELGDAVVFSPRVVHASAGNTSNRIRLSVDVRLFGAETRSSKHHMNLDTLDTQA